MLFLGVTLLISLLAVHLAPNRWVADSHPNFSRFFNLNSNVWAATLGWISLLLLIGLLYLVNQRILHSFLSSGDEHSCYFLAECLRKGRLYVDMPPLADFFKVAHVGMKGGKWFSVYPPGWPLLWALGLNFNIVDWLNPVMTALSVFFFYLSGKKLFGSVATVLGLFLMCMSPFFMFTAASYFSHATCLLCISIFLYAFLRWREAYVAGGDPIGWASLCAFAVGYGLMTRYLTMAAVAGPFFLYHYLPIFFDRRDFGKEAQRAGFLRWIPFKFKRPMLRKSDWLAVGVIGFFMLLILWQNYIVTGKPFKAPNKYDKSWERLGFRKDYTPLDGLFFLISRVFYLMDWFAPAIVAAYLFLFLSFGSLKRSLTSDADSEKRTLRTLFLLTMVFIAFAYFFYYSWGGNQWGPRYLWEGMPFLCIAAANWIVCRWQEGGTRIRKFLLVFYIASLATSGVLFAKHAEFTEGASRQRRALYALAEQTVQGPALVFIHGFLGDRLVMAEEDATRNSPFLDGRILYAHDLGDRNRELMTSYPGRIAYRGIYDRKLQRALLERLS